jgi:hypothetical protein
MGKRMVTIATFDQPAQARIAENVLKEVGIPVTVADETIVAMDWLLSNAVGGIKVQVWEEDADRAVAALERELGEHGEALGAVTPAELAAEAEAEEREHEEESPRPADATDPPPPSGEREEAARRLFFVAWIGLVFPPVAFYALYLFLNAAFGEGELSPRGKLNLGVGGVTMLGGLAVCYLILNEFVL